MKCPNCPDSTLVMADRVGIEIDYCPTCRGVWLDRGELDKIIERSTSEMNRISQPEPRSAAYERPRSEHNDGRNHHGRKRRKSFLHDLFD